MTLYYLRMIMDGYFLYIFFLNLLVFLGGYEGRISCWQWYQLEGANLFKDAELHNYQ